MQVEQFDAQLQRMLRQKPEKASAIKSKPGKPGPIIPKPQTVSDSRQANDDSADRTAP
jgi:hypothetical protein